MATQARSGCTDRPGSTFLGFLIIARRPIKRAQPRRINLVKDGATDHPVDSEIHRLIDLKTGAQVGQLVIFSNHPGALRCEVDEAKCWSVKEWNALVDAYMKD